MDRFEWTTEKPTSSGWYWIRVRDESPCIKYVFVNDGDPYYFWGKAVVSLLCKLHENAIYCRVVPHPAIEQPIMSEAKHTPGPWQLDPEDWSHVTTTYPNYHVINAGDGYHDEKSNFGFSVSGFMSVADARLIAAAPELLAALNRCQDYLGGPWCAPEDVIEQVRAAIAKAEGRE